jgi:hypothetical protein
MGFNGLESQMWTVLIAKFWCVRILCHTSKRLPRGPPRARRMASSLPHSLLMMCGVQASALTRGRVILVSILAILMMLPGSNTGLPLTCQSLLK